MFCLSESDTFYLYPYPTDMRKSFYSLSGIVTNEMKHDELYRRAVKAERRCEELSDTCAMKQQYENRLKEKDNEIARIKAGHQKEISKKEDEIRSLAVRIEYLTRKLWEKMSEKRQTPDDPRQLKLDFEGMDLTDEEKHQIEEAARKVAESRKVRVREHEKQMPVRKKLPENLRHPCKELCRTYCIDGTHDRQVRRPPAVLPPDSDVQAPRHRAEAAHHRGVVLRYCRPDVPPVLQASGIYVAV